MRRSLMVMVLASLCAFGLAGRRTARADEACSHGCTSHSCKPLHHGLNKLGFSYFMKHKGQGCCKNKNPNCRTYIDPHRAPRDFWMLR